MDRNSNEYDASRASYIRGRGFGSRMMWRRGTVREVSRSHRDSDSRTRMAATRTAIMAATNYKSEDETQVNFLYFLKI